MRVYGSCLKVAGVQGGSLSERLLQGGWRHLARGVELGEGAIHLNTSHSKAPYEFLSYIPRASPWEWTAILAIASWAWPADTLTAS
jgi:hypothetical protein